MVEFPFKDNFSEFNGVVKRQKSGTAIGAKFAPPYSCIFMDKAEAEFLKSQEYNLFYGLVILTAFFIWTYQRRNWTLSLVSLTNLILI